MELMEQPPKNGATGVCNVGSSHQITITSARSVTVHDASTARVGPVPMVERRDVIALLAALGLTAAMVWAAVYFVQELWPLLPPAVALLGFIGLAVLVIGYPIYALSRWSNRYLAGLKRTSTGSNETMPRNHSPVNRKQRKQ
jgi:xanthosine utilization system XapX-like protein